jgi:hypothetical protein
MRPVVSRFLGQQVEPKPLMISRFMSPASPPQRVAAAVVRQICQWMNRRR